MLFRALTIVFAAASLISLSGCITGETLGCGTCCSCYPNAITLDGNPVPGNGDAFCHVNLAMRAQGDNLRHAGGTIEYWAFNTNADYPPYETFACDQFPRAMYQIGKKFDEYALNYDWDDPFYGTYPNCCPPRCGMRYCDPCRSTRCDVCNNCSTYTTYDSHQQPCSSCSQR